LNADHSSTAAARTARPSDAPPRTRRLAPLGVVVGAPPVVVAEPLKLSLPVDDPLALMLSLAEPAAPSTVPPVTAEPDAAPPTAVLGALAAPDADAEAPAALLAPAAVVAPPVAAVDALAFALAWNCAKVLSAVGLMAKVMPEVEQWGAGTVCRQKNHSGVATVTLMGMGALDPFAIGMKPESKPCAPVVASNAGVHGEVNSDWVTEWFFGWKTKLTISPTAAVIEVGVKASPLSPTSTVKLAASARAGRTVERAAVEKRILLIEA